MAEFTHFDDRGGARMVDVGEKERTARRAVAAGRVYVRPETLALIRTGGLAKGDVLGVARLGGILGAKATSSLIPLCHPLMLSGIELELLLDEEVSAVEITATVSCSGQTGVEMEALTAVSVAALTVYDMCKSVQKDMVIGDIRLLSKTGGKSGDFRRRDEV